MLFNGGTAADAESGQFIGLHRSVNVRLAHWRAAGPPVEKWHFAIFQRY
nr:hypothetical protein [uncultured Oscillibacter sp.]